jgi:hypothetical protein
MPDLSQLLRNAEPAWLPQPLAPLQLPLLQRQLVREPDPCSCDSLGPKISDDRISRLLVARALNAHVEIEDEDGHDAKDHAK